MELERIAETLIYTHAGLGGAALLAGAVALISNKGRTWHKRAGKVFYYTMLVSALLALVVSVLPGHENPFLFSIGVFSAYFILSGFRSLNFKRSTVDLNTDKLIAYIVIATGLAMIAYPIIALGKINIVLLVFGVVGIVFGIRDVRLYRDPKRLRRSWLQLHLGKMTGGYIAATTAFFVVNQILPGVWNWFVPGIIGTVFITYWMRKTDRKKSAVGDS